MKIHVNPNNGDVGKCRAHSGKCPYVGENGTENHYETFNEAYQASEKVLSNKYSNFTNVQKVTTVNDSSPENSIEKAKKDLKAQERKEQNDNNTNTILHNNTWLESQNPELANLIKNDNNESDEAFLKSTRNFNNPDSKALRKKVSNRLRKRVTENPQNWDTGQKAAKKYTDRDSRPEYIESIDKKHIKGTNAGSKFTDRKITKAEDVLSLALAQRGNLNGDDREKLISAGADKSAFLPPETGVRYIQVKTNGTEALKDTSTMKDDEVLTVMAKGRNDGKPASLSLTAEVSEQPKTDYATIIIGPKMDDNKQPIPETETLWTMHPGTPSRGIRSDTLREKGLDDGAKITVGELRKVFGKDIKVNTKLQ